MVVNKVYNWAILHPTLKNSFQYSIDGEYLALSSDSNYATLLSEQDMLTCVSTRSHMHQVDMSLYPTEKVSWCLYTCL